MTNEQGARSMVSLQDVRQAQAMLADVPHGRSKLGWLVDHGIAPEVAFAALLDAEQRRRADQQVLFGDAYRDERPHWRMRDITPEQEEFEHTLASLIVHNDPSSDYETARQHLADSAGATAYQAACDIRRHRRSRTRRLVDWLGL